MNTTKRIYHTRQSYQLISYSMIGKLWRKKLKYPGNNMFMSLGFYQIFIQGHILDIFETDYLVVLSTLMNPYMITRLDDLK